MKLEINTEIVFSTAHICEEDNDYLIMSSLPTSKIVTYNYEYGHRIWVDRDLIPFAELSNSFWELYKIAKKHGCKWLVLDCDGCEYDELESFKW